MVVAAIVHDESLLADPDLMPSVAATAAIALERARLEVDLRAGLEQLQASRARIVEAGDTARRRIERDLHDGAQQRLVSLALLLARMEGRLAADDLATTRELVGLARHELTEALRELRELARGIHPAVLTDHGLAAALRALAERIEIPVTVTAAVPERCPPAVEAVLYFVASEALTNTQKHAGATSAAVTVTRTAHEVELVVADDGRGGAGIDGGSGLRGLADRVEALRGTLSVRSPAGAGTEVRVRVPCTEPPAAPPPVTPGGTAARRGPVDGPGPWAAA
jgi:signal transduction histidine kinase